MKQIISPLLQISLCTAGYLYASGNATLAQVTSDGTVNTQVNQNGSIAEITGGETRGSNLFHSFQDFSVPTGNEAFFNNADSISNIFSRVTGGNISNIDGAIRANSSASLFLINPAGIIFGENARLDIGGSFYGSSASSILFEDGEFSATDLENPPLLTVNAPIGLGFRDNPGDIVNRSLADGVGLEVETGKSLALVGGDISLEGGILTASEGNIELGSVAENSVVNLEKNNAEFDFQYDGITNFGNIELTQGAIIDSSGEDSGGINLQGNQISLQEGSQVRVTTLGSVSGEAISVNAETLLIKDGASISSTTIGKGNAGDIKIEASESIEIVGTGFEESEQTFIAGNILGTFNLDTLASGTGIFTGTTGAGTAGNINLDTSNLSLQEGAVIGGFTFGEGAAGNLTINATESVEVVGSLIANIPTLGSTGNGNRIEIKTTDLNILNGGLIGSSTFGTGDGGNIRLDAAQQIEVFRTLPNSLVPTGIFTNSIIGRGKAGNININAQNLSLKDGGQISSVSGALTTLGLIPQGGTGGDIKIIVSESIELSGSDSNSFFTSDIDSSTFTNSNAGDLDIETKTLIVGEGASINASTINSGNGGDIFINAYESITIFGTTRNNQVESSISSVSAPDPTRTLTSTDATGDAGSLSIMTGNILISDNGTVSVDSLGLGNAGKLEVRAYKIEILNKGQIIAETAFGSGGNITLDVDESLTLRSNSLISAKAEANANGGNIDIDTNFIIAFPNGNNDILASAEQGRGGNININAELLLGIEQRPLNPQTNDINASSEVSGLDGTVNITTPDINPVQGVTELPTNVVEPEQTAQQACEANREAAAKNGLNITGKGGIVPDPALPLNSLNVTVNGETNPTSTVPAPIETSQGKIQPARGVKISENGEVILTAYRTNNAGDRIPEGSANCGRV